MGAAIGRPFFMRCKSLAASWKSLPQRPPPQGPASPIWVGANDFARSLAAAAAMAGLRSVRSRPRRVNRRTAFEEGRDVGRDQPPPAASSTWAGGALFQDHAAGISLGFSQRNFVRSALTSPLTNPRCSKRSTIELLLFERTSVIIGAPVSFNFDMREEETC
jgi:hypothetical protein